MKAWYFSTTEKKLLYQDGRDIAIGTTHIVDGMPIPCEHGLHGSVLLLDALKYAPGPVVWEVELGGTIVEHVDCDKYAATQRTYLRGGMDVSKMLWEFSRWAALSVAHLWNMPRIVREYLETGDESKRDAANTANAYAAYSANAYAAYSAYAAANTAYSANTANAYAAYSAYAAANAAYAAAAAAYAAAYANTYAAAYANTYAAAYANTYAVKREELNAKLTEMIEEALAKEETK